jgi:hypothetical protein
LTITQKKQLQLENQEEKKIPTTAKLQPKVQNPQIQYQNKNKNYKPNNNTYHKIHKSNQRAKREKIASFIHKLPQKHRGKKNFERSIINCWGSSG